MNNKILLLTGLIIFVTFWIVTAATGPFQNAFNAGEVSPMVKYRIDLQQYASSCQTVENMVIEAQGAANRRPGTEYIHDANDMANTRLIPFEYSTDTAYVLEFGNKQLHFYTNGGRIQQ